MELKVTPAVEVSSVLVALEALGLHSVVEVKREDAGGEDVQLTTKDGEFLTFANVILRHLGECAPNNELYGDLSVQEKAQVDGWLAWGANELVSNKKDVAKACATLEGHLTTRTCMVGASCTLADVHLVCELVHRLVEDTDTSLEQMPVRADSVLGRWISKSMTSVPALGTTLTAMLESSRARVTALKKEKQPFQPELVRMQKMKAILGEGNKPSAPSAPKAKAQQQPVVGGGLAPVEEDPNQEAKEVDEEKEARKAAKKAAKEAEKTAKAERKKAEEERKKGGKNKLGDVPEYRLTEDFPNPDTTGPYGNLFIQSECKTNRTWRQLGSLGEADVGQDIWVRCRVHNARIQGKRSFVLIRQNLHLMQVMVDPEVIDTALQAAPESEIGKKVVAFAKELTNESVIDVLATVTKPPAPIQSDILTIKQYELLVKKLYCVSKAKELPFQLADASRPMNEGGDGVQVHLETRLNHRVIDLRTRANQGIFRIQSGVCTFFREFLLQEGFIEIHSPKMLAGGSEGGAEVFRVDYFPKYGLNNAFLAQSPQLYKQMALMCDFPKVFEIGPVFRSEDSFTHRHMTEFMGLDMEMHFVEHYHEVLDVLDRCFRYIFNALNDRCSAEIEAVRQQFPFANMLYNKDSPCKIFTFKEAIDLLRTEGPAVATEQIANYEKLANETTDAEERTRLWDVAEKAMEHRATLAEKPYLEDVSTKDEKILGEIVKRKYQTEFYIIDKFPAAVRPFYTMPDPNNPEWSNSYDIFMRGEEIMSGAQRIHDPELLVKLAKEKEMVPDQYYTDSFSMGAFPHAGGGVGLERVVMLFLGLDNIRRTSLFPRDPKRLTP
ncbi:unnamed protein product [Amoebophrya sp. A120]|nr:unnamed protein product [Amoebophrya sp. A120]|eukprot:GSA120T00018038001.1